MDEPKVKDYPTFTMFESLQTFTGHVELRWIIDGKVGGVVLRDKDLSVLKAAVRDLEDPGPWLMHNQNDFSERLVHKAQDHPLDSPG